MREYDITDVPNMVPEVVASIDKKVKIEKKEVRVIAPPDSYIKSRKKAYARKMFRQRAQVKAFGHNRDGDGIHPPTAK